MLIEYAGCNYDKYYAEFKITGLKNRIMIEEVIRLSAKQMVELKIAKKITTSLEFLRTVKYIKDNLHNKKIKSILVNLAVQQSEIHNEELEELKLILELSQHGKPSKPFKNSKGVEFVTYDALGRKIYF